MILMLLYEKSLYLGVYYSQEALDHIKIIELEFCTISHRHDGIIEQRFLRETPYEVGAEHIVEFAETITLLSQGERMPLLSIAGLYGSMTTDARGVDINDANHYTLALGLVIQELPQRLLANFYFKLKKIDYPVKTFKNEDEAIEWLQHQVRINQKAV
jgi:hypothetical protein